MKIRRMVVSAILGAVGILSVGMTALAGNPDFGALSDSQAEQANAVLSEFCAEITNVTQVSASKQGSAENPYGYRVDDGLKVQMVSYFDEADRQPQSSVQSLMAVPNTVYMIPYSNDDCCGVYTLSEGVNGLQFSSQTIGQEITNPLMQNADEIRSTLVRSFDRKALASVRYCLDSALYLYTVEIQSGSESYVIPYFDGVAKTWYSGIEEGAIYKSSDFERWVAASFERGTAQNADGELLYGGSPLKYIGGVDIEAAVLNRTQAFPIWGFAAISGAALVLSGIFLAVQHGKKSVATA